MSILSRLFPRQIDNAYRGPAVAIWLLVPIVLFKFIIGFNISGFDPWVSNRQVLQTADGVPLATFGARAASEVVFGSATWGLAMVVLCLLGVIVLVRYRAMIPLMYLLLAIEQIGRKGIAMLNPIGTTVQTGVSPALMINWTLSAALVFGFALSLIDSRRSGER